MVARVLIIGGYGNFGSTIARWLADDDAMALVIGGRNADKASRFAGGLNAVHPALGVFVDITADIDVQIGAIKPDIIIHTTGPFQTQDYAVARAAINHGSHYLDLADARKFVGEISVLDDAARKAGVLVVSGASSVPCLTAAVIDHYRPDFSALTHIDYGISAAQQTNRGLATLSAVLSYIGKPFLALRGGRTQAVYGWLDLHAVHYPQLGWRLFGNCDIPDLDLFPARYDGLETLRFAAGHEIKLVHLGTWALSWLVRWGVLTSLAPHARGLLRLAFLFDPLSTSRSGFHMILSGVGADGAALQRQFYLMAGSGHGPHIPCLPSVLLAKALATGALSKTGAMPCLDLITLPDYLAGLEGLDIAILRR